MQDERRVNDEPPACHAGPGGPGGPGGPRSSDPPAAVSAPTGPGEHRASDAPAASHAGVAAIELLGLTALPEGLGRALTSHVSRRVALPCHLRHAEGAPVEIPWLDQRDQVDADALLARLETRARDADTLLVGVTTLDIGNPVFSFFFGRARQGGRAALVSLARLTPGFYGLPDDEELTLRRATREVLHELGHLAGLPHCRDFGCVMRFASTVEAIDTRGGGFCSACAAALPAPLRGTAR